ncbi:MAG TPA: hypothetical protein VJN44_03625 [Roseateles sp.]|nr:hypothetical protein [Roseateles sp.]
MTRFKILAALARLSEAFRQALETPEIRGKMVSQGAGPAFLSAEQCAAQMREELPRWAAAVKRSGAKVG